MKENDKEEQPLLGAERGTAYHRVFELLDMECADYTEDVVSEMIERLVETKKLSK